MRSALEHQYVPKATSSQSGGGVEPVSNELLRSTAVTALIIGISGGSGSGKTRLARELAQSIGEDRVSILPFDCYYKDLGHLSLEERNQVNFDHPDSLDVECFAHHLEGLRKGMDIAFPIYDFSNHRRVDDLAILPAREIIIAEGILLFAFPELMEKFDFTIFRQCSEETRFARRLERDTVERERSPDSVTEQFKTSVAPMHDLYVEPTAALADRVVQESEDLDMVVAELSHEVRSIRV